VKGPSWARLAARVALIVAVISATAGAMTVRALVEGEREYRASGTLLASGELEQAIVRARRAAAWYVPGAAHVPAAYERLIGIAKVAEGRSDTRLALLAWHAVRSASLSSRWVVEPHTRERLVADASIARLSARLPIAPGAEKTEPEVEREVLEALSRHEHPFAPWVLVLLSGFGLLTAGFATLGMRAVDATGKPSWRRAHWGIWLSAAGLIAWALGLWRA